MKTYSTIATAFVCSILLTGCFDCSLTEWLNNQHECPKEDVDTAGSTSGALGGADAGGGAAQALGGADAGGGAAQALGGADGGERSTTTNSNTDGGEGDSTEGTSRTSISSASSSSELVCDTYCNSDHPNPKCYDAVKCENEKYPR